MTTHRLQLLVVLLLKYPLHWQQLVLTSSHTLMTILKHRLEHLQQPSRLLQTMQLLLPNKLQFRMLQLQPNKPQLSMLLLPLSKLQLPMLQLQLFAKLQLPMLQPLLFAKLQPQMLQLLPFAKLQLPMLQHRLSKLQSLTSQLQHSQSKPQCKMPLLLLNKHQL